MSRKRKPNYRNIIIAVSGLGICIIIGTVILLGLNRPQNQPTPSPVPTPSPTIDSMWEQGGQEKPSETQDLDAVQINLVEYTVYQLEDLDFRFVIAKIRVKGNEPIRIGLSHFVTDEKIALDQIDSYLAKLDDKNYFVGKQGVWFELISPESSYIANIFVPVIDNSRKTLNVGIDFGTDQKLELDLSNPAGTKEMLQYAPDDVISDGKTYQLRVSSAYPITGDEITQHLSDGSTQEVTLPSTAAVYAFNLEAISLWGDVIVIEQAQYVTSNGVTFDALSSEYEPMKTDNIIGQAITEKGNGTLIFITLNASQEPIDYKGELKLKIKGQDNWITIKVDL